MVRCQHTPGVVCQQDISSAIAALKSKRVVVAKPMLSHSAYPKTYAYSAQDSAGVGESDQFLNRYFGKDVLK